jgi:hypothetical protein
MTFGGLPILAPLRHAGDCLACLLIGEYRKWSAHGQSDANDPEQTLDVWPHLLFGRP